MNNLRRPSTLAEVAEWSASENDFSYSLTDFLHEFAARPDPAMIGPEPRLLAAVFPGGEVCDAYLAATASSLSHRIGASRPMWADAPERYLKKPWFASAGSSMRACLLLESPAAFRERNLFVTANALCVA